MSSDHPGHNVAGEAHAGDLDTTQMVAAGLLTSAASARINPTVLFRPTDELGDVRGVVVEADVIVGAYAIIHGGTTLRAGARIEDHAIVGYRAPREERHPDRDDAEAVTDIGPGSVVRSHAIIYAGARLGERSVVGHYTLVRSSAVIGADTRLGHHVSVGPRVRIGRRTVCATGAVLAAATEIGDDVVLGGGVHTVDDHGLDWRPGALDLPRDAPSIARGARIAPRAAILAGVHIEEDSVVGPGEVVTAQSDPPTPPAGVDLQTGDARRPSEADRPQEPPAPTDDPGDPTAAGDEATGPAASRRRRAPKRPR